MFINLASIIMVSFMTSQIQLIVMTHREPKDMGYYPAFLELATTR